CPGRSPPALQCHNAIAVPLPTQIYALSLHAALPILNAGLVGKPMGNSHPMLAPYDLIQTADRPIFLPSGNDGQMPHLAIVTAGRSEEHTSELQSPYDLVCRLLLEKKNKLHLAPIKRI